MTVCVLSDIHANHLALEACLARARELGVQRYVFLGDYISDGPYPQKTMELVYETAARYDCRFIRGNREEYMLGCRDGKITGWRDGSATGSLLYTYENLTEQDLSWFDSLGICGREGFEGAPSLLYCHGSPWKANGTLPEGDAEVRRKLGELPERCIVCGHTHRMGFYFSEMFSLGTRQVVRAGSVGYPLLTPGQAQMVLLHSTEDGAPRWRPEYVLVPYDVKGFVREMKECGLLERAPVWSAMVCHAVLTGENMAGLLPPYAQALYKEDTGLTKPWGDIPETYWRKAAEVYKCRVEL